MATPHSAIRPSPNPEYQRSESIGLVLIPGFSMMTFASFIEPLRQVNRIIGREVYRWSFLACGSDAVPASSGAEILVDHSIEDAPSFDYVFVCAGLDVERTTDERLISWLQKISKTAARLGAFSTATFVLARAGVLKNHKCTVHWESLIALREQHPELRVSAKLFEIDRDRITCAGATACIDLMLHLIEQRFGHDVAAAVAAQYNFSSVRQSHDEQHMPSGILGEFRHPKVVAALAVMENHVDDPLQLSELADYVGLSKRQLQRLFTQHIGHSVIEHYRRVRLQRARQLLIQTNLQVRDVAIACGYRSMSHFSRDYRRRFNRTPLAERTAQPNNRR